MEDFCTRLKDVVFGNSCFIHDAVKDDLDKFNELLQKCGLVTLVGERNYETLIKQFCTSIEFSGDVNELEKTCQNFLHSLLLLGSQKSIEISRKLRKELNSRAVEIGLPQSFLSKEMLRKEETSLLKELMVKPLCFEEKQKFCQHRYASRKKFEDRVNPHNESFVLLQKFCQQIVHIICTKKITDSFAARLCEAKLVTSAMIDQAKRMENKLIQAKAIMGAVRTIIQRAVIPDKLMKNFIAVLNLREFSQHFKVIIAEVERKGYTITKRSSYHKQRKVSEVAIPGSGMKFPPLRQLMREDMPSDPYRRYLYMCYQRLKPVNLCSSPKEWKFFDLASNEQSVIVKKVIGEALDLRCLPQDSVYPPRTLITGAPGVGKSSIVIELCKRWVNGDLLQEYDYVIHLRACDPKVNNAKKINDLVPEENQEWLLHPITKANGNNSLFIVDGYDELSEESRHPNSFIGRIIQGEILNEASIIVTTRPWCANKISEYFPNEVEILGFTPQGREEYIQHFLKDDANNFSLQQTATVERCLSIPFYLATLIEIFKETRQNKERQLQADPRGLFPTTVTKVYGALICTLVLRFVRNPKHDNLSKFLPQFFDIAPGEFIDFPNPIYLPLLELCALSYKSLSDPASLVPEPGSVTFDLLNEQIVDTTSGRKGYYKFLHSSIGEYLAAYCISRMESGEMEQCVKNLKQSKRYGLVLEFLYGFGCIQSIDRKEHKVYRQIHNFDVLRQLCEADSRELVESVYKNIPIKKFTGRECSVSRSFPSPTPADFWCLGRVIAMSNCDWYLGFTYRPIQNNHLKMLYEGIRSVDRATGRIRKIGLSLTKVNHNGLCHVVPMCLLQLEELHICGNQLNVDVIRLLQEALSKLPMLKKFLFHHNEVQLGEHEKLILELAKCRALKHVSVTDLLPKECRLLLVTLEYLEVVEFWRISTNSCKACFGCIPGSSVKELQIHESYIDPICVRNLPETLPASRVQHLKLINCGINCATVEVIAEAASRTIGLQSLDLSDNCIEDRGGETLLGLCWELRHLKLLDSYKFNDYSSKIYEEVKRMKQ